MAVFGLLNINKPRGPTSYDLVKWVRRGTGELRVGHAGTLDPMATGVLVVCLGPATRLSDLIMHAPKTYRARLRFGIETDTYDATGAVVAESDVPVTRAAVETALESFRGEIEQVPPMYSALKRDGVRLYTLARAGVEIERPARPVTIYRLDLTTWDPPFCDLDVQCSSGTYIRSLVFDLGRIVGAGAHLTALERAASGGFTVADAVPWADLDAAIQAGTWRDYLLPPDRALATYPALHLSADDADHIRHGRTIPAADGSPELSLARAYDPGEQFIAVLERCGSLWKPQMVFDAR